MKRLSHRPSPSASNHYVPKFPIAPSCRVAVYLWEAFQESRTASPDDDLCCLHCAHAEACEIAYDERKDSEVGDVMVANGCIYDLMVPVAAAHGIMPADVHEDEDGEPVLLYSDEDRREIIELTLDTVRHLLDSQPKARRQFRQRRRK